MRNPQHEPQSPPAWWCGLKYGRHTAIRTSPGVTTCVVVWIEISHCVHTADTGYVTTCVVVWIEIHPYSQSIPMPVSPPAWWCGLKCTLYRPTIKGRIVTTCVVVWIEIWKPMPAGIHLWSPPAWWCGLKFAEGNLIEVFKNVTTCVVVWIEISCVIRFSRAAWVTTCVVVWIEMLHRT